VTFDNTHDIAFSVWFRATRQLRNAHQHGSNGNWKFHRVSPCSRPRGCGCCSLQVRIPFAGVDCDKTGEFAGPAIGLAMTKRYRLLYLRQLAKSETRGRKESSMGGPPMSARLEVCPRRLCFDCHLPNATPRGMASPLPLLLPLAHRPACQHPSLTPTSPLLSPLTLECLLSSLLRSQTCLALLCSYRLLQ